MLGQIPQFLRGQRRELISLPNRRHLAHRVPPVQELRRIVARDSLRLLTLGLEELD